jgi:hypothetical protein
VTYVRERRQPDRFTRTGGGREMTEAGRSPHMIRRRREGGGSSCRPTTGTSMRPALLFAIIQSKSTAGGHRAEQGGEGDFTAST